MVDDSVAFSSFRKRIKELAQYRGRGTELISVYITPNYPLSDIMGKLRDEYGQAANIKSKSTQKNVQSALEKIMAYLRGYQKPPENGLAVFAGNVSEKEGKVDVQLFSVSPPMPLGVQFYRCESQFVLEPFLDILENTDSYGIVVMDGKEATVAMLKGTKLSVIKQIHSTAHSKTHKGGQCLAPETLVQLDSGEIMQVKDFTADSMLKGADFASNLIDDRVCSSVFSTPAKKCFLIKTREPSAAIHATPFHRFFKLGEHGFEEVFANRLKKNDLVAMAGFIPHKGANVETNFFARKTLTLSTTQRRMLKERRIKLGLSQQKAADLVGLSQMIICRLEDGTRLLTIENAKKLFKAYGLEFSESMEAPAIALPKYYSKELAQLLGVICGDGTLDGNRIIIYEGKKEMVEKYVHLIKKAIGVTPVVRVVDKTRQQGSFAKKPYYELRIYSLDFASSIAERTPQIVSASEKRDIPSGVLKCNNAVSAGFLRGFFDAEGYLNKRRVAIASVSKPLLQKTQLLLLRFGIVSSLLQKNVRGSKKQQWALDISDFESVKRFREKIGFSRSDKQKQLEKICSTAPRRQLVSRVPVSGKQVFKLAKSLGLKTSDFSAASSFFRDVKPLGRNAFEKNILPVLLKRAKKLGKQAFVRNQVRKWLEGNLVAARVSQVTKIKRKENYFDLTVPYYSNFVANSFIVHNSSQRYQRLREEGIEYFYKRIGEAMNSFVGEKNFKGVVIGGPGPAKEDFAKDTSWFNHQIKVLGIVDTGYTDEYGLREVIEKSKDLIALQEAVMEKQFLDDFMKKVVTDGLVTYGYKQVYSVVESGQAEKILVTEGLSLFELTVECTKCGKQKTILLPHVEHQEPCECGGLYKTVSDKDLVNDLIGLAEDKKIKIQIVSRDTAEGSQFFGTFGGLGAYLRYK